MGQLPELQSGEGAHVAGWILDARLDLESRLGKPDDRGHENNSPFLIGGEWTSSPILRYINFADAKTMRGQIVRDHAMTSRTEIDRLAFEADIRAKASSYSIQLFLGRGQFERAQADTLAEAVAIGNAMKEAHPACQAQPIYYAVEPSGHSTTITPAQMQEDHAMTNANVITINHSDSCRTVRTPEQKQAHAERMRAARAKAKAQKGETQTSPTAAEKAFGAQGQMAAAAKSPAALGIEAAKAEDAARQTTATAIQAHALPEIESDDIMNVKQTACGLCMTKAQAETEGKAAYGEAPHTVKKTVRGEFYWGPYEEPTTLEKVMKATRAAKTAKPAGKPGKAKPRTAAVSRETKKASAKAAPIKRTEVLAAAERGVIPSAPDFSAETHKRFRGKLAEVVALVEARNVAGLKAYKINPVSSSPKAIDKYRNLALIALKAK